MKKIRLALILLIISILTTSCSLPFKGTSSTTEDNGSIRTAKSTDKAKALSVNKQYTILCPELDTFTYNGFVKFTVEKEGSYTINVTNMREKDKSTDDSTFIGNFTVYKWDEAVNRFKPAEMQYEGAAATDFKLISKHTEEIEGERAKGFTELSLPIDLRAGETVCLNITSADEGLCDLTISN